MDNYAIADHFSLLAKLMDIHGENSFKSRSYSNAAFQIEKLPMQLSEMSKEQIAEQKGIGDSIAARVVELLHTGKLQPLEKLLSATPTGVVEMLNIKGLGPKKIQTVWKEMEIESIGELLYACNENRLTLYKGFGEKTQQNIKESIQYYLNHQGFFLYQQAEEFAMALEQLLPDYLPEKTNYAFTGAYRRQSEVVDSIEILVETQKEKLHQWLSHWPDAQIKADETHILLSLAGWPKIKWYSTDDAHWGTKLFETTGTEGFLSAFTDEHGQPGNHTNEEAIFSKAHLPFIPPYLRESAAILHDPHKKEHIASIITPEDIRGIIHTHSVWSDGSDTIETMARHAIALGLQYLVISDHSKSAGYANGLSEDRIRQQQQEIDALNEKLAPFRIFKSIECDILGDGSLDYSDRMLSTFDLVIASVHSNLKMNGEKAMLRLLNAISNPYVTILGHMTGRLLLSRDGYPVDHEKIIEACAANHVAIELNAHPRRLDMDWRWIQAAVKKGVMISIDPDSHAAEAFSDTRYGVLAAQKGMLKASQNLSSLELSHFERYLAKVRSLRGI